MINFAKHLSESLSCIRSTLLDCIFIAFHEQHFLKTFPLEKTLRKHCAECYDFLYYLNTIPVAQRFFGLIMILNP